LVEDVIPERENITTLVRGSWAFVRVVLTHPDERERSQQEIASHLTAELRKKTKARANVVQQSTFGGRRARPPIQYVLQAPTIEN
jgi:multidrug efflux pump